MSLRPVRQPVDSLENLVTDRPLYLNDCENFQTQTPIMFASLEDFRARFGAPEGADNKVLNALKRAFHKEPEFFGLVTEVLQPGRCTRFSLILGEVQIHAIIKVAPGVDGPNLPHLDALQMLPAADDGGYIACGTAGIGKACLNAIVGCFGYHATMMREGLMDKDQLQQSLIESIGELRIRILLSRLEEASKHKTSHHQTPAP